MKGLGEDVAAAGFLEVVTGNADGTADELSDVAVVAEAIMTVLEAAADFEPAGTGENTVLNGGPFMAPPAL